MCGALTNSPCKNQLHVIDEQKKKKKQNEKFPIK